MPLLTAGYVVLDTIKRSPRLNVMELTTALTAVVALTTGTTSCQLAPMKSATSATALIVPASGAHMCSNQQESSRLPVDVV